MPTKLKGRVILDGQIEEAWEVRFAVDAVAVNNPKGTGVYWPTDIDNFDVLDIVALSGTTYMADTIAGGQVNAMTDGVAGTDLIAATRVRIRGGSGNSAQGRIFLGRTSAGEILIAKADSGAVADMEVRIRLRREV